MTRQDIATILAATLVIGVTVYVLVKATVIPPNAGLQPPGSNSSSIGAGSIPSGSPAPILFVTTQPGAPVTPLIVTDPATGSQMANFVAVDSPQAAYQAKVQALVASGLAQYQAELEAAATTPGLTPGTMIAPGVLVPGSKPGYTPPAQAQIPVPTATQPVTATPVKHGGTGLPVKLE